MIKIARIICFKLSIFRNEIKKASDSVTKLAPIKINANRMKNWNDFIIPIIPTINARSIHMIVNLLYFSC